MHSVTIIGPGNVGSAVAALAAKAGATVQVLGRDPQKAAQEHISWTSGFAVQH